jgi:beta-lactamase class A
VKWQSACLILTSTLQLYGDESLNRDGSGPNLEHSFVSGFMNSSNSAENRIRLDYQTLTDATLQTQLEQIDEKLRASCSIAPTQTAVGVLDLLHGRLAMIHPDHMEYAASVAKLGILLAYFELNPNAAEHLDAITRHELGLMAKISSNEMASKFSHQLGLRQIQRVLDHYGFYDKDHGGGIWVGKHYGQDSERIGDPIANNSHAVTVRQLLRFYLLLDQGKLVSPAASRTMLEILATPDLHHDDIKFVRGLQGRKVEILRKWGSWEDLLHDSAIVSGDGRRYILVGLTHHPKGDDYLVELATAIDDLMIAGSKSK